MVLGSTMVSNTTLALYLERLVRIGGAVLPNRETKLLHTPVGTGLLMALLGSMAVCSALVRAGRVVKLALEGPRGAGDWDLGTPGHQPQTEPVE